MNFFCKVGMGITTSARRIQPTVILSNNIPQNSDNDAMNNNLSNAHNNNDMNDAIVTIENEVGTHSNYTASQTFQSLTELQASPAIITPSDNNSNVPPSLSTLSITPKREEGLFLKMSYTPSGELCNVYKYYCPLCMSFFKDILKSKCCGNYVCIECCTSYLEKRSYKVSGIIEILSLAPFHNVNCPNCNIETFDPDLVIPDDPVRDYTDGPLPLLLAPSEEAHSHAHSHSQQQPTTMNSPLKIGDTFEDIKRKMLPLNPSASNIHQHTSHSSDDSIERYISGEVLVVSGRRSDLAIPPTTPSRTSSASNSNQLSSGTLTFATNFVNSVLQTSLSNDGGRRIVPLNENISNNNSIVTQRSGIAFTHRLNSRQNVLTLDIETNE